ncbi:GNAT family N-acetyltransferase [Noviherbaspirillum aridicola]|uniref:GCN5 family N-acetyltransferase n=1 Tax=Noviherbaspirillum aridicola TaxID=2849687 RepID=A0ABQ4Q0A6_9BURK|nr:GNAT family N-acetyltransferase [Noviherbaspirillum aridicola]GIZ50581.1 GCN5 family N-acetyltransferase [Noviherbaspirillum aridicola]
MIHTEPVTLELNGVRLEPMTAAHAPDLARAAADGELWKIRVTSVPAPGEEAAYIDTALSMRDAGSRLPFVVRDLGSGTIIGSTSYHDIVPAVDRVEIGYTWYARSWQRTHVNTSCKLMLLRHAFDTLGCKVVGFRTDNFNHASREAIARLGAQCDGVIRHSALRRDGTVRDTVMFSITAGEWPEIRAHLEYRLGRFPARAG